ncbi:MAG: MarR family transcriptional regulator [Rhodopseudomonas sp.]|nr:MarR family transcriptional regulator [Rhodopseudomonas sp.]
MPPSSPSDRQRFGFIFSVLARRWRRLLDTRLAAVGLTDATWTPLIHLFELGDGISQKDLAARVGLDGSSLVRLLDILTERGLVARRVSDSDRRANLIYLTDAGHAAVVDIRRLLTEAERDMLAEIGDDEIATMLAAFERIGARIEQIQTERDGIT